MRDLKKENHQMRAALTALWDEMRYNGAPSKKSYLILEGAIKNLKKADANEQSNNDQ